MWMYSHFASQIARKAIQLVADSAVLSNLTDITVSSQNRFAWLLCGTLVTITQLFLSRVSPPHLLAPQLDFREY